MTFWFYDHETNTLRFGNCDEDSPLCASIREWSRAASPALWFYSIVGLLRYLGNDLPPVPLNRKSGAVLLFWDENGDADFFPLARSNWTTEDTVKFGYALHEVAQAMIEDPESWFEITVPEAEDGMEDGEGEEEGDFSYHF